MIETEDTALLQSIGVGKRHCRVLYINSGATGIDIIWNDLNGGHGSAVSLQLIGRETARAVSSISIPAQPELILSGY